MAIPVLLKKFQALPLSRDQARVLIQWEVSPTRANLSDFEFYIDRGETADQIPAFQHVTIDGRPIPGAPTTASVNQFQIAGPISALDFYQYVDATPEVRNLFKIYYYRIRLRQISTQEEVRTPPFTWQGDLDLVGLYVVDEHNFLLEDTAGVPCLIYPRKRGGLPCPDCFDPIQKKRLNSYCQSCFGTNWLGGFYAPLDAFIDFGAPNDTTAIQDWGETQPSESDILYTNYPFLEAGYVVRELREDRMWRVVKNRQTEKRRTPMLQFVRLIEINPGDVEYKIPADENFINAKIQQFEEIRRKREF